MYEVIIMCIEDWEGRDLFIVVGYRCGEEWTVETYNNVYEVWGGRDLFIVGYRCGEE